MLLLVALACGPARYPCGEGTHAEDGHCMPDVPEVPECPLGVDTFCEQYLGGACPTWDEAERWTCDGYRFDPTGTSDQPVEVRTTDHADTGCPKSISCDGEDGFTTLYFENGELWVSVGWPEDADCGGRRFIGSPTC
ncbi:MAG: hypothetical protein ACK4YP_07080 [Myxococcota bacterium]